MTSTTEPIMPPSSSSSSSSSHPSTHTLTTWRYSPPGDSYEQQSSTRELGSREVLIKTTHSGLCYTDVQAKHLGCGLGHEGVGFVVALGAEVTAHEVGDRVGWGYLHQSCNKCMPCVAGSRQHCPEARGFGTDEPAQGSFGDYAIWDETFVYGIPDAISSASAAPLMCAGATVFEALDVADTKPAHHVGVVGVGGLGHIAVLFAKAMGCAVTAFSSREAKRDDAFKLGADVFRSVAAPAEKVWHNPGSGAGSTSNSSSNSSSNSRRARSVAAGPGINTLLISTNEVPALEPLLPLLARRASIVLLTMQTKPLTIPYLPFVLAGHRLMGSCVATRPNQVAMLDFVARHDIRPWIQTFPMTRDGLADAFRRLENGDMRYRGVLVRKEALL